MYKEESTHICPSFLCFTVGNTPVYCCQHKSWKTKIVAAKSLRNPAAGDCKWDE